MIASQRRILHDHLRAFAQLSDDDVQLADAFWGMQTITKHDFFNFQNTELLVMQHDHLLALYPQSHGWERFGRLLAEQYLILNQARLESFLTQTAEERYVDLLNNYPNLLNRVSLGHISSYLGVKGPSLSRIRAQMTRKYRDVAG